MRPGSSHWYGSMLYLGKLTQLTTGKIRVQLLYTKGKEVILRASWRKWSNLRWIKVRNSIKLLYSHMESKTKTQQHFQEMQRNTQYELKFTSGQPVLLEEENGNSLQESSLENSMDREAWRAIVHGIARVRHDLVTNHHQCTKTFESY